MLRKSIVVLIFINFLSIIYAAKPIKSLNSEITTVEKAAEILAEIEPSEVLPLVFFEIDEPDGASNPVTVLQIPEDLLQVVTKDGKMVEGTKFASTKSKKQLFFCGKATSSGGECFAPRNFSKSERLQCANVPTPIIKMETNRGRCGFREDGIPYSVLYEICPKEKSYKYETTEAQFYGLCYDKEKKKNLFTTHMISSPKLLQSKLLFRERNIEYPFSANEQLPTANYKALKNAIDSESDPSITAKRPKYKVQKLVPSTDMSVALWKKTLYQFVNIDLQHKALTSLWDKINGMVTEHAAQRYDNKINYYVRTGVFDIFPVSEEDDQMYNMWAKMVVAKPRDFEGFPCVVIILMNNFINDSEFSESKEKKIEDYCENDLCVNSLTTEFSAVKGRVRCCAMTEKIGELFGLPNIDVDMQVLQIPGITSLKPEQTLRS